MDFELLARELLRALRAHRSQRAFSRYLGYRTNVLYTWESGRRYPTAAEAFRVARKARVDVDAALRRFLRGRGPGGVRAPPPPPGGGAARRRPRAGGATRAALAEHSGLSRHAVGRFLAGRAEPRLPDFLRLVEAASLRSLDLVALLVDPLNVPSIADRWSGLVARRSLALELPWSQAILRCLELEDYLALPGHRPGWLAARLGLDVAEEARCLEALEASGQIVWDGRRYRPDEVLTVDTRPDPEAGRRMRRHWSEAAIDHIARSRPGLFSYNVFAVSREDFERLQELHLSYFRALRAVVAGSSPSEVVAVANVQLFELNESDGAG